MSHCYLSPNFTVNLCVLRVIWQLTLHSSHCVRQSILINLNWNHALISFGPKNVCQIFAPQQTFSALPDHWIHFVHLVCRLGKERPSHTNSLSSIILFAVIVLFIRHTECEPLRDVLCMFLQFDKPGARGDYDYPDMAKEAGVYLREYGRCSVIYKISEYLSNVCFITCFT